MIDDKLLKVINESLPGMVGSELKQVLEQGQKDKARADEYEQKNIELSKEVSELKCLKLDRTEVQQRESSVRAEERELEITKKLLELEKKLINERLEDIKNLTSTVFQSNRLGYNISLDGYKYDNNTGSSQGVNVTGTVNGQ